MSSSFRVFVANLPWTAGHAELRKYFQEFGRVMSARVVFDKNTGVSRGYGFVTFANREVWEQLSNQKKLAIDGMTISVQKSSNRLN